MLENYSEEESYFHKINSPASIQKDEIISELLDMIETNIGDKLTKKERRHLFSVIVELIQNIQKYSIKEEENNFEIGYDVDQNIIMNSINFTTLENKNNLEEIINKLKGKSKNEVKEMYDSIFSSSSENESTKGLGISYVIANSMRMFSTINKIDEDKFKVKLKILY